MIITKQQDKVRNLNDEVTRQGEQFTKRIASALKKESWRWWVIELAWTAGPATFIGLYSGYFIGYGKTPNIEILYYFATYTAIAGIMALIVRMVRNISDSKELDVTQRLLLRTSNEVFRNMVRSRDCMMSNLDESQRKITAATVVLKDADATEDALGLAVNDLTGSRELSRAIQRVEIFRHHGMKSRINDELEQVKNTLNAAIASLNEVAPQAANLLERRFMGDAPSMLVGQERYPGFLERTIEAINNDDIKNMTNFDVFDVFYLAFELLNGREIAVLHPIFNAQKDYVEAQRKLDKSRSLLKHAISKRNSRLKATVEGIATHTDLGIITAASFSPEELIDLNDQGFKALRQQLKQALKTGDKSEIRHVYSALKTALAQYEKVLQCQNRSERYLRAFRNIRRTYNKLHKRYGQTIKLDLQDNEKKKNCISILESTIMLDDEGKVIFSKKLKKLHNHIRTTRGNGVLNIDDYKAMAMEYIVILDEILNLSQNDEILAIEHSNAACFSHIDINAPAREKVGFATLSIEELQQSRQKVAHRLAKNLREYYHVPLSNNVIDYFVTEYGAERKYLEELNHQEIHQKNGPETKLSVELPLKDWERLCATAMLNARLKLYKKTKDKPKVT